MPAKLQPVLSLLTIVALSITAGAVGATLMLRPEPSATGATGATATAMLVRPTAEVALAPTVATVVAPAVPTQPIVALPTGSFQESFDGAPATPQPWSSPAWEITVHSRDVDTWEQLEPMEAVHGPDCAPPPATHTVSSYEGAVFPCRDHRMTAISAAGYGAIYLTPNQLLDFSQGEAVIRWDMSTLRSSGRDWVDLWITPFEDNLQLPLDMEVDLSGPPRNAIHLRMDFNRGLFTGAVYREFVRTELGQAGWESYEDFLTPDAKRRDTFEVRVSRDHLRMGMPGYNYLWVDSALPDLGWSQGVVQLGHHSYNPTKDCESPCGPNTWHWDNIQISPAQPFTLIKADRRYVDSELLKPVALSQPVPEGAFLRFAGIGEDLEVSFDGGQSWQPAQRQAQDATFLKAEHFQSYWTPIPPGVSQVQFRGESWYGGDWNIRDISVWAP